MAGLNGSIKSDRLNAKLSTKKVSVSIGGGGTVAITDHSLLTNLEYLKSGHTGFAGIEFDTTANWNAKRDYRPPEGMLVVYTDYETYENDQGEMVVVPGFKIGDGNAYLIDKPFIGEAESELLRKHIQDQDVHIRPGERERWDDKLNCLEPETNVDLLIFTRD